MRVRFAKDSDADSILGIMQHYNMHRDPFPEMPDLDTRFYLVAEINGAVVGASGFKLLSPEAGKTTLTGVLPGYTGRGIGMAIEFKRLAAMKSLGCEKVLINADRSETIAWYQKHFNCRKIETIEKHHSYGSEDADEWTALECDLTKLDLRSNQQSIDTPPLIINAALTGTVYSPKDSPYIPMKPGEIARDAKKAAAMGVSVFHLHARDDNGTPSMDPGRYSETICAVRNAAPGCLICASTSGRLVGEPKKRAAALFLKDDAKPDMASLTLGSMNFPDQISVNTPKTLKYLAETMAEKGIKPELEVFDLGMLDYARYLVRKGYLRMPLYVNVLLGNLGTLAAREKNAEIIAGALPLDSCFSLTGIGRYQQRMVKWAVNNGAHVRIGLEDNLRSWENRDKLTTNEELVRNVCGLAHKAARKIATPEQARRLLGFL